MNFKIKVKGKDNRKYYKLNNSQSKDIFKFGLHTMYLYAAYWLLYFNLWIWWQPYQQTFGTSYFYYRCYLPVLAGFVEYNCEVTGRATIARTEYRDFSLSCKPINEFSISISFNWLFIKQTQEKSLNYW